MASEILAVPEQYLEATIWIIRAGIEQAKFNFNATRHFAPEAIERLTKWCDDEEAYLHRLEDEDDKEGTE